uniref:Uncharacterized protein n=1 Tax=Rhizophora mucronata TaxID=61149 RepID=A0A2P2QD48_RHIMU
MPPLMSSIHSASQSMPPMGELELFLVGSIPLISPYLPLSQGIHPAERAAWIGAFL